MNNFGISGGWRLTGSEAQLWSAKPQDATAPKEWAVISDGEFQVTKRHSRRIGP